MSINFYSKNCPKREAIKSKHTKKITKMIFRLVLWFIFFLHKRWFPYFHWMPCAFLYLVGLFFIVLSLCGLSFNVNLFICVIKCSTINDLFDFGSKSISVVCVRVCVWEIVLLFVSSQYFVLQIYSGHRRLSAVQNLDRITYSRTLCVCGAGSVCVWATVCVCACILGYGNRICLDTKAYLFHKCLYTYENIRVYGTHNRKKTKNWISIAEPGQNDHFILFCLRVYLIVSFILLSISSFFVRCCACISPHRL